MVDFLWFSQSNQPKKEEVPTKNNKHEQLPQKGETGPPGLSELESVVPVRGICELRGASPA